MEGYDWSNPELLRIACSNLCIDIPENQRNYDQGELGKQKILAKRQREEEINKKLIDKLGSLSYLLKNKDRNPEHITTRLEQAI